MIRAALTGGIATGKSYVLARIAAAGVPVVDADAVARAVVAPGTKGLRQVTARFGAAVVAPDGTIDRAALARIVFADPAARADLEAIVHPAVYAAIDAWYAGLPAGTPAAVADIPLLYETGHDASFDLVVVTACPPAEQVRRLIARDGLSEDAARARLAAQWPIEQKVERADVVISTGGSFEETDAQVDALVRRLTSRTVDSPQ